MSRVFFKIVIMLLCIRLSVSCGTIIHGSTQDIDVRTNPDDAEIWIDGARVGKTPTRLTLKRNKAHLLKIVKEGYKDSEIKIDNSMSSWIIGNVIFGGLIGCGVDLITGGAYDLKPERLDINLVKAMAYNGSTINIPQSQLDTVKELHIVDENGQSVVCINLSWED